VYTVLATTVTLGVLLGPFDPMPSESLNLRQLQLVKSSVNDILTQGSVFSGHSLTSIKRAF
jgi:hypothetical protein